MHTSLGEPELSARHIPIRIGPERVTDSAPSLVETYLHSSRHGSASCTSQPELSIITDICGVGMSQKYHVHRIFTNLRLGSQVRAASWLWVHVKTGLLSHEKRDPSSPVHSSPARWMEPVPAP